MFRSLRRGRRATAFVDPAAAARGEPVIEEEESKAAPGPPLRSESAPPPVPSRASKLPPPSQEAAAAPGPAPVLGAPPFPEPGIFELKDGKYHFYRVDTRPPAKLAEQGGFEGTFGWPADIPAGDFRAGADWRDAMKDRVKRLTGQDVDFNTETSILNPLNNLTYNGDTVFAATDLQGALNFGLEEQGNKLLFQDKEMKPYYVYRISIPEDEIAQFKPLHVVSTLEGIRDPEAALPIYESARQYMDLHHSRMWKFNDGEAARMYGDAFGPAVKEMKWPRPGEEAKEKKTPRRYWPEGLWIDDVVGSVPTEKTKRTRLSIANKAAPFQNEVQFEGPIPLKYIEHSKLPPITFDTKAAARYAEDRDIELLRLSMTSKADAMNELNDIWNESPMKQKLMYFVYMQELTPAQRRHLNLITMEEAFPFLGDQMFLHKNPEKQEFEKFPEQPLQSQSAEESREGLLQSEPEQVRVVMNPAPGVAFSVSDIPESEDSEFVTLV
jgi:hypothetical protein